VFPKWTFARRHYNQFVLMMMMSAFKTQLGWLSLPHSPTSPAVTQTEF